MAKEPSSAHGNCPLCDVKEPHGHSREAWDRWAAQRTANLSLKSLEAGAIVLWEKQFENTPWAGKVHLIRPESLGEYMEVARRVWEAMRAADQTAVLLGDAHGNDDPVRYPPDAEPVHAAFDHSTSWCGLTLTTHMASTVRPSEATCSSCLKQLLRTCVCAGDHFLRQPVDHDSSTDDVAGLPP